MKKLFICLITLVLFGCVNDDLNDRLRNTEDYLPFQIGNYWNFQVQGINQSSYQIHREIMSKTQINNREYYLVVDSSVRGEYSFQDSSYFRIDSGGSVFIYYKGLDAEDNPFRLYGKDGEEWTYIMGTDGETRVKLSVTSVVINNKKITGCKSYYSDMINWADDENTITLAPGIGFIKEYSDAWGIGFELISARINGKDLSF